MKLLRMSAWITGGLVLTNLLLASDVLILGMVVSPAVVTTYVLTGAAARMAVTLFNFTVGATTPGLGGVIGQRDMERAARVRAELVTMTWLFVTVGGATILLWNHSFVSLWVGSQHYAGAVENLLIVAVMAQTAFIRGDAFVIDAALRPRPRVIVTAIAAVLSVGATLALTPAFGIVGLCIGILIGRLPQTVVYPVLVASCLRKPGGSGMSSAAPFARVSRPRPAIAASAVLHGARRAVVMIGMLTAAAWLGQRMVAEDWLTWIGGAAATVILALAVAIAAGLTGETRRAVIGRGLAMARTFRA